MPADQPSPATAPGFGLAPFERLRQRFGRRAIGLVAALLLELLLIALLLTLGRAPPVSGTGEERLATFDVSSPPPQAPAAQEAEEQTPEPTQREAQAVPVPEPPPPAAIIPRANPLPMPQPTRAPIVPMSKDDLASSDIANLAQPRPAPRAGGPAYGPSFAAAPGDSEVVGKAPDGSPLYAARWYREPSRGELTGYLSTASPGWALIACKTAPQWRVEDCVGLDEYPQGSNMLRAVLAAAWQFQVRPPRRGNDSLVGSWVRIRIDYTVR